MTIYAGQFTLLFEVLEGDLFLVLIMIMIIDYIILYYNNILKSVSVSSVQDSSQPQQVHFIALAW